MDSAKLFALALEMEEKKITQSEAKTLEELPKFKVKDKVRLKKDKTIIKTINYIYDDSYSFREGHLLFFKDQDEWELVPDKFDISTLVPFESRVLVRNSKDQYWIPAFWGFRAKDGYVTTFGHCNYCIPYESNEHLRGEIDDCNDFYKTWE